jgi:replicative DNA helicase
MEGRSFPQAIEAERALLGGLIESPSQIDQIVSTVKAEDFYRPDHSALFALLLDMKGRDEPIDSITVPERIGRDGRVDDFGGLAYVVQLVDHVPSTANLGHYAGVIREKALLREVIQTAGTLRDRAFTQPKDVGEMLEGALRQMQTIGERNAARNWHQVSLVVDDEVLRIEQLSESSEGLTGTSTGFVDLNEKLAGLHPTDLLILAARPAMGKTALALNIAQNAALIDGIGVGLFSLEMSRGQLVTRMLCCQARVEAGRVRTGRLAADDWERLLDASETLRKSSIYIDDTPGVTIMDLRIRAKQLKAAQPNLGLLVIDYLQLMQGEDPRSSRQQQISDISRGLKILAKDLSVPVLALSQLNRAVEQRADKRPMVSDLRESGAIEQDADVIMFIYRDEIYNPDTAEKGLAEVIIAKQRNGPTGTVKLVFQGQFARFDNYADDDLIV